MSMYVFAPAGSEAFHNNLLKYAVEFIGSQQKGFGSSWAKGKRYLKKEVLCSGTALKRACVIKNKYVNTRLRNSIRRAAMLVWKQFLSGISGTRSSYGECMTAFAECSAGKHGKAAAFGQNTHISVHQRQMFVKLLSILRPCNVHGFCL